MTAPIEIGSLEGRLGASTCEPERECPVDCPFAPDHEDAATWYYVRDVTGQKLAAFAGEEDGELFVALRNAAPALIAIAKAALAYMRPVETEQDARNKETARRALLSALQSVRP